MIVVGRSVSVVVALLVGATCWKTIWIIQGEGDLFGAFVNGNLVVGHAGLFFGVEFADVCSFATIPDRCSVLLPTLGHSYQSSLPIGIATFSFL